MSVCNLVGLEEQDSKQTALGLKNKQINRVYETLLGKMELQKGHLSAILSMVPAGISVSTDVTCREIIHNPMASEFLRIKPSENLSHSVSEPPSLKLLHNGKELSPPEMPIQRAAWNGEEVTEFEIEFVWDDGVHKTSIWNTRPLLNDEGVIIGAVATFEDVTKRRELENEKIKYQEHLESLVYQRTKELKTAVEELKKSHQEINNIIESITDAFFILDNKWRFTYLNNEAEQQWGRSREHLIGKVLWEEYPEAVGDVFYKEFFKAAAQNKPAHWEAFSTIMHKWVEVHAYPSPEGLFIYFRDISKKKQMEKEMARLDRLNLVGQMAAGIGHEIRNPMTTVRGFLQIFGSRQEFSSSKEHFDLMIEELDRANSIITDFLSLAKNRTMRFKSGNLNDIIKAFDPLLRTDALISEKFIHLELGADLPEILLDEKEIRQLLLNLVRNGLEAMPSGGRLTIKTYMDGPQVVLSVSDEGLGIDPEIFEKIGTPFLTTKEHGTGLGLAVCYSIAARHKANIKVETGSRGTTFFVRFNQYVHWEVTY